MTTSVCNSTRFCNSDSAQTVLMSNCFCHQEKLTHITDLHGLFTRSHDDQSFLTPQHRNNFPKQVQNICVESRSRHPNDPTSRPKTSIASTSGGPRFVCESTRQILLFQNLNAAHGWRVFLQPQTREHPEQEDRLFSVPRPAASCCCKISRFL